MHCGYEHSGRPLGSGPSSGICTCVIRGQQLCLSEPPLFNRENGGSNHLEGLLVAIHEINSNRVWRTADVKLFLFIRLVTGC